MKAEVSLPSQLISSRIAVASWTLRPENPHHLIERLQELGISAIKIGLSQILNDPAQWGMTINHLRDHAIWIVSGEMHLKGAEPSFNISRLRGEHGILGDHYWFYNRIHAEQIARLAERAGIQIITTLIGGMPGDPDSPEWAKLLDRWGALGEIFAHYGLTLAVRTGQANVEALERALDQVNLPSLAVDFDPAEIIINGIGDPIDSLRRLAHRAVQAHVRDAVPARSEFGQGRETGVGRGQVDWNGFFDVAMAIQPPIHFVIDRDARTVRDQDITAARDLIAYHLSPKQGLRR